MIDEIILKKIAEALHRVADIQRIQFVMIGASARDLLLKNKMNVDELRATYDLDFAVRVRDWQQYKELKSGLLGLKDHRFEIDAEQEHRLHFDRKIVVDLVPFGGVANEEGYLHWPTANSPEMHVLGLEEALQSSLTLRMEMVEIKVVTFPALALIKLITWNHQPVERRHDGEDFGILLQKYEKFEDDKKLYDEHIDLLDQKNFEYSLAWNRILGREVGSIILNDVTARHILSILARETSNQSNRLVSLLRKTCFVEDEDGAAALAALESFETGIRDRHVMPDPSAT